MPDPDGIPVIDEPVLILVASPDGRLEDNEMLDTTEIIDADTLLLDEMADNSDDTTGVEEPIALEERVKGVADVKSPEMVDEIDSGFVDCTSDGGRFLP